MRILVIRTSAMGDVALLTPVLSAFRKKYPDDEISLMTRKAFNVFFYSVPGLKLVNPDFSGLHRGLAGLYRLSAELAGERKPDLVIDLHDVLRTKVLRFLLRLKRVKIFVINKGRTEKRALISGRKTGKLKHTVERYCEVFSKAGFPVEPERVKTLLVSDIADSRAKKTLSSNQLVNIGVAPFARHHLKEWPAGSMKRLLQMIYHKTPCNFWFFGGKEDSVRIEELCRDIPNSVNLAGKLPLEDELAIMGRLAFMIAMDSSNMHMAALSGIIVISVWGATDPSAGFGPWMQPDDHQIMIAVEDLECRPCTIYGKGECKRGDFACMNWLTPETVFEKIISLEII